ncbi:MAG TPA: hypothetical protein VGJ28_08215 [Micromonosporaceae bacterium]|jgi:hypothetical protein
MTSTISARMPFAPGRILTLYARSRHVPGAVGVLIVLAAFLWADLRWGWSIAGGAAAQQLVPLVVMAGAAAAIGVATYGPLGEAEKATGRWLPLLRLGTAVLLSVAAAALLAAAGSGGRLATGDLELMRDLAGSIGVALLTAAAVGGQFAWIGPIAYWLVTESALASALSTPLIWPTLPSNSAAAMTAAVTVAVAGFAAITVRGAPS